MTEQEILQQHLESKRSELESKKQEPQTLGDFMSKSDKFFANRKARLQGNTTEAIHVPYERPQVEPLTYQQAKEEFWDKYKTILGIASPKVHPDNVVILRSLVQYFIGDPETLLETHRGVCIYGQYGSGKSMVMKGLGGMMATFPYHPTRRFFYVPYKNFKKKAHELDSMLADYHRYDLYIDDLGYEEHTEGDAKVVSYGDQVKVVQEIIRARYEVFISHGVLTHVSTNKTYEEFEKVYGAGTATRMSHMSQFIYWRGENLRP